MGKKTIDKENIKKNNFNYKVIFFSISFFIIIFFIIFAIYKIINEPKKRAEQMVKDYLNERYSMYTNYAKINSIKLVFNDYKQKDGCFGGTDKNIKEYVFQYNAEYLGNNSDNFYITLWNNTIDNTFEIAEVDGNNADGYLTSPMPHKKLIYKYTDLWEKICPEIVNEIIRNLFDENNVYEYKITSKQEPKERYYYKFGENTEKHYFEIEIPIDIKTEYYKNKYKYELLLKKLYSLDSKSYFYIKFKDLNNSIDLENFFLYYDNLEEYIVEKSKNLE